LGGFGIYRVRSQTSAAPTYTTVPVTRGDLVVGINATGAVSTTTSLPLTFAQNGQLSKVLVQPGDHVTAVQVLTQQDTADLQHAVAQAAVAAAQQTLTTAQQHVQTVQQQNTADLAGAQGAIVNAQTAVPKLSPGPQSGLWAGDRSNHRPTDDHQ